MTPLGKIIGYGWMVGLVSSLFAADWPQWRGPHRNGISADTGLLQEWPENGPRLLWEAKDLGGGYSTPSVVGGRVYGMGYVSGQEVVWALNEQNGKQIWRRATGPASRISGTPGAEGPRSTPTVDADRIYTLGPGGRLSCLNAATGELIWKKELAEEFGGEMMSLWAFSESVLVDGDRVVCTPGGMKGAMLALNKTTGAPIWQTKEVTDRAPYCSMVVAEIQGVRQYVQLTSQSLFGVAPDDGKVLWQAPRRGRTAVATTPIVDGNFVYVTSGYGVGCNLFEVTKSGDQFEAKDVYGSEVIKVMVNHHGGVVLVNGAIFGYSEGKGWVCQDFKSGKALWSERSKLGKGCVSYADHRLYLRAESGKGTVALLEPSRSGYVEKGRFDQPDRSDKNSWPHPVIANGKLLLRDQGVLLAYEVRKSSQAHSSSAASRPRNLARQ